MKTTQNKKASWTKPEVKSLNIKKDTFSGTVVTGTEDPKANTKNK